MGYIGTSINGSATLVATAGADIPSGEFLAVKFDEGAIVVCGTAGENALGLVLPGQDGVKAGDDLVVQIKECGLWKTGAGVAVGAELTTDKNGACITATSGDFILGIALQGANAAGEVIQVQVAKAGYKAGE